VLSRWRGVWWARPIPRRNISSHPILTPAALSECHEPTNYRCRICRQLIGIIHTGTITEQKGRCTSNSLSIVQVRQVSHIHQKIHSQRKPQTPANHLHLNLYTNIYTPPHPTHQKKRPLTQQNSSIRKLNRDALLLLAVSSPKYLKHKQSRTGTRYLP
jgi:hypothetical protein